MMRVVEKMESGAEAEVGVVGSLSPKVQVIAADGRPVPNKVWST